MNFTIEYIIYTYINAHPSAWRFCCPLPVFDWTYPSVLRRWYPATRGNYLSSWYTTLPQPDFRRVRGVLAQGKAEAGESAESTYRTRGRSKRRRCVTLEQRRLYLLLIWRNVTGVQFTQYKHNSSWTTRSTQCRPLVYKYLTGAVYGIHRTMRSTYDEHLPPPTHR